MSPSETEMGRIFLACFQIVTQRWCALRPTRFNRLGTSGATSFPGLHLVKSQDGTSSV
jgi:hypothetical protein